MRPDGATPRGSRIARAGLWLMIALTIGCATAYGLKVLKSAASSGNAPAPTSVRVRLSPIPSWMPRPLARELAGAAMSPDTDFSDPALTKTAYERMLANPWIRSVARVQKKHTDDPLAGILEIQAQFRQPVAKVILPDGGGAQYVDAEGVSLPDDPNRPGAPRWVLVIPARGDEPARQVCYRSRDEIPPDVAVRRVHYIHIEGVEAGAPPIGRRWKGQDMADALRLLGLIRARRYANQVFSIDVRNHNGRICRRTGEPHIRIHAIGPNRRQVEIRFGRFPLPGGDYVISPKRRMTKLDDYVVRSGGCFGRHARVDLRYDQWIHVE